MRRRIGKFGPFVFAKAKGPTVAWSLPKKFNLVTTAAVVLVVVLISFCVSYRIASGTWPTANWFGAFGTWFGGAATAAAVLWSVQQFRAEQDLARSTAVELEQKRWKRLADRAEAVQISISVATRSGQVLTAVRVEVKNRDAAPLLDLTVTHPLIGTGVEAFAKVEPYGTSKTSFTVDSGGTSAAHDAATLKVDLEYSFWLEGVLWIYRTVDRLLLPAEDRFEI